MNPARPLTIRLPSDLYRQVEQRAAVHLHDVHGEIILLLGAALDQPISEPSPATRRSPGSENDDSPGPASGSPRA